MSTVFFPRGKQIITAEDLFAKLTPFGLTEQATADGRWIVDVDGNHVLVSVSENGTVGAFTRYGANDPIYILRVVCGVFGIDLMTDEEAELEIRSGQ